MNSEATIATHIGIAACVSQIEIWLLLLNRMGRNTTTQVAVPASVATPTYLLTIADAMVKQGIDPASTSLKYAVLGAEPWTEEMRHELEVTGLAEDELREAARLTGGRFYREEDLPQLAESITPRSNRLATVK